MNILLIAVFLIAFIVIFLALKSRGAGMPMPPAAKSNGEPFKPFQGEYEGVSYTAESLESNTVTVSIDVPKGLSRPLEVNARKSRPAVKTDGREEEIEALLRLGADYIDIGFNTNRAAAEFPAASVKMSRLLAEKATVHLKRITDISL